MRMLKVIEKRRSVREYKDKHISESVIKGFNETVRKQAELEYE